MKMNLNNYGKGDLVKFVRQWSGLTQLEFAKRMGKSKRTIEQYEAGTVNYKINFIEKMMKEFDLIITIEKK